MTQHPVVITQEIPIEWFLNTIIIRHEAVNMGLMPTCYLNENTFHSHIYHHTSMHIALMVEDKDKINNHNTASMRVLLGSLVTREFDFWDTDELEDFKGKADKQMSLIKELDESGEVDFETDPYTAIVTAQEKYPEILEIGDKWHAVFHNAFTQCNRIVHIKQAQTHDCGIWQIIQDHAFRRN